MEPFTYTLVIEAETSEQAAIVLSERLGYDEEYDDPETGKPFDYRIGVAELDPSLQNLLETSLQEHMEGTT